MNGRPHIVIGGGGHARVLIMALRRLEHAVIGITDNDHGRLGGAVAGIPVLGSDEALAGHDPASVLLVNGIGSVGDTTPRRAVFDRLKAQGFSFATVVDPKAFCETDVILGEGAQVLAGAVVQTGAAIGPDSIVNTRASVDHDCRIGGHCHIGPGAVLSGTVTLGDGCHVGTGAAIIQGIEVGDGCIIGAGSAVIGNVTPGLRVGGVPAREIQA